MAWVTIGLVLLRQVTALFWLMLRRGAGCYVYARRARRQCRYGNVGIVSHAWYGHGIVDAGG